jgi:hypothetical protein
MNIKEAVDLKTGLEQDIEALLSRFEAETGLRVHGIAHRTTTVGGVDGSQRRFLEVRVDVKI